MNKRILSLFTLITVLALFVSGCGAQATQAPAAQVTQAPAAQATQAPAKSKVVVWLPGDEGRWFIENKMDQEFMAANPQYQLEVVQMGWDVEYDKLVAGFASGDVPDAAWGGDHMVGDFAGRLGGLRDVQGYLDKYHLTADDYLPGDLEFFRLPDGKIYGIPSVHEIRMLFYRTDLLQQAGIAKPPETLEELVADGLKLTNGTTQFGLADQTGWLDVHFYSWLLSAYGGKMVSDDLKTCILDNPTGLEALNFYKSLYDQNIIPKDPAKQTETFTGFKSGYYAMVESGTWWFGLIKEQAPELAGKWAVTYLPAGKTTLSYGHPQPMLLPLKAKNPDGGDAFVHWLTSPAIIAKVMTIFGEYAAVPAAFNEPILKDWPNLDVMQGVIKRGSYSLFGVPNEENIIEGIGNMLSAVKTGVKTPEQAAKDECNEMNSFLNP